MNNYEDIAKKIYEFESKYEIGKIKVNDLQIWPLIKSDIISKILHKENYEEDNISKISKFKKIKPAFYGLSNLLKLKNYKYILFTDTLEKRFLNGFYIDKIAQGIIDEFNEGILIVENPVNNFHYPLNECKNQNIISLRLFQVMGELIYFSKFKNFSLKIGNENIIKDILNDFKISFNYEIKVRRFLAYVNLFENFFKKLNLKYIFVNCYYCFPHIAAIYAAKKQGIKVIELQHGIISNKHRAYFFSKDVGKDLFPDYLFVFGDFFKQFFDGKNFFIDKDNVYSIGSYYIEEMKKGNFDIEIKNSSKYKKVILVSSQYTVEEKLLDFIIKVATKDKENFYIFRPRFLNKKLEVPNLDNFYLSLDEKEDIYKLLKMADIHVTVYSTVCLEALSFGVPNIMVNMDNFSKLYFNEILNDDSHTVYVNNIDEFLKVINFYKFAKREEIIEKSKYFFAENHKLRIKKAIEYIERKNFDK
jgi:hypothetical protein